MFESNTVQRERRKLLGLGLIGGGMFALPVQWTKPIVDTMVLPAHAQTSMACVTDTTVGGPLLGNPSGATTCQAACEAEATAQSAQLCNVTETTDATGAIQCSCELDLP